MELRLLGVETEKKAIANYYTPVFKVVSRAGKSSNEELDKRELESQMYGVDTRGGSVSVVTTQRLPGGATVGLTLSKQWGRDKSRFDPGGDVSNRSSQDSYQLEAKQPLLRGAGAASSVVTTVGKLSIEQASLTHEIFLQEDLLRSVSIYSDLLSGRQNVLQAQRSLQASRDFLIGTRAQVNQGVLANSEVDQAQFSVSQGELELAYAQQAERNAIDQLKVFSGLTVSGGQAVQEFPQMNMDNAEEGNFPEETQELEVAKLNVQIAQQQQLAADDNDALELNFVTSLGKGWVTHFTSGDEGRTRGSGWRSQFYVGLELSKTLNDYPARAAIRKSRLAVEEKQRDLQSEKLRLNVRRVGVRREYVSSRQYVQLIKKKIEVAARNVANERFKIEAGRSTAFMVYSAQSNLAQAQGEYIEATSRYIVAAAQLYKEQGRLIEFFEGLSRSGCPSDVSLGSTYRTSKG